MLYFCCDVMRGDLFSFALCASVVCKYFALATCILECTRSKAAPQGYTLPAFSWFIDQTIGGAVATATHGSSFVHGSLSNQASPHHSFVAPNTVSAQHHC